MLEHPTLSAHVQGQISHSGLQAPSIAGGLHCNKSQQIRAAGKYLGAMATVHRLSTASPDNNRRPYLPTINRYPTRQSLQPSRRVLASGCDGKGVGGGDRRCYQGGDDSLRLSRLIGIAGGLLQPQAARSGGVVTGYWLQLFC